MIAAALAALLVVAAPAVGVRADVAPQAEAGFTLAQALAAMREGHPLLGYAAARADAAEAVTVAARLWENPELNADYYVGVRESSYDRAGSAVVTVGQWFPLTGAPRKRGEIARHESQAVAHDNRRLVRALELEVEAAMLRLAGVLQEVEIQRGVLADLLESRRIVEARVASGVAPQYDATRIGLAVAEAEANVRSAEASAAALRGELDVAVGPGAERLRGAPQIDLFSHPPLPPVEELRDRMLHERPDLAAAAARVKAAREGVSLARREVFPGIGVRVGFGFGQGPGQFDIGGGLSVPLPVLSRGQGFIDRARAESRASESLARSLAVAAEQRLRAAHEAARQRREASQRHVEMNRDAAAALRRQAAAGYQDGRLSVLELADASLSVRDMRLRDLELALAARLAELELRAVVEVGRE